MSQIQRHALEVSFMAKATHECVWPKNVVVVISA